MPNYLLLFSQLAFTSVACVFALAKGGVAERVGAGVVLANLLATLANDSLGGGDVVSVTIDGLTALVFLGIAVRFASLWLGVVMLLYALQFSLHAFYFVAERPRDYFHALVNNIDFFSISVAMVVGTIVAMRRRAT